MKRILILALFILILSSCTEEKEDLSIELSTFKIFGQYDEEFGPFKITHEPKLITTYEEYLENLRNIVASETSTTFKEDFFINNSLIILPVVSHKEPDFSVKSYKLNDGLLEIEILQENSLERNSNLNYYMGNSYILGLKINSKEIQNFSFDIYEQSNYYESYAYILDSNILELENNYKIIEDYSTYTDLFGNIEPYPYHGESFLDIVSESTFEDSFVFVYIDKNAGGEEYITPTDLYIIQYGEGHMFVVETIEIVSTAPVSGISHDSLLILIVDKDEVLVLELVVNLTID